MIADRRLLWLLDALWLLALAAYVAAGMRAATFHGDEVQQIAISRDYATAFIHKQPQSLGVSPPYEFGRDSIRSCACSVAR